jgi:hypothetical protein
MIHSPVTAVCCEAGQGKKPFGVMELALLRGCSLVKLVQVEDRIPSASPYFVGRCSPHPGQRVITFL